MHALVVGGDVDGCGALVDQLRAGGYDTLAVTSARGARDSYDDAPPDVLLVGLTLPDGDGLRLCEEIRARFGDEPVIMLVGAATSRPWRLVGFEFGADDVVDTPCDGDELLARLEARLRRRQYNQRGPRRRPLLA